MPDEEEALYSSLVNSGPEVIELDEEPEEHTPAPPSIEKDVAPVKGRGRGKKLSPMPLLKFLHVLMPRPPFNAMFLQPPPWLEVPPALHLPPSPIR